MHADGDKQRGCTSFKFWGFVTRKQQLLHIMVDGEFWTARFHGAVLVASCAALAICTLHLKYFLTSSRVSFRRFVRKKKVRFNKY